MNIVTQKSERNVKYIEYKESITKTYEKILKVRRRRLEGSGKRWQEDAFIQDPTLGKRSSEKNWTWVLQRNYS